MERVQNLLKSETPVKWLFYGDSITHGSLHTFGKRDYVQIFSERVRFELKRTMDVVINTAICGNTSRDLLKTFDWRVSQFSPHAVFVMIGMNDCSDKNDLGLAEFKYNIEEITGRIARLGAVAILQTACPILPGAATDREPYFPSYMDAIRQIALDLALPLIDHTRFWEHNRESHFFWMSNAFHPNAYGHRAFAHLIFRALGIYDQKSPCCRLYLP